MASLFICNFFTSNGIFYYNSNFLFFIVLKTIYVYNTKKIPVTLKYSKFWLTLFEEPYMYMYLIMTNFILFEKVRFLKCVYPSVPSKSEQWETFEECFLANFKVHSEQYQLHSTLILKRMLEPDIFAINSLISICVCHH